MKHRLLPLVLCILGVACADDELASVPLERQSPTEPWSFNEDLGELCGTLPPPQEGLLDVMFIVDTTGSMGGVIGKLQTQLLTTMAQLSALSVNSRFAVAHYEDFMLTGYSNGGDMPYTLLQPLTDDTQAVTNAINSLTNSSGSPIGGGGDTPESTIEALYQAATGEGLASAGLAPSSVGWRSGSFRVAVVVTDAAFRDPDDGDWAPEGAHGEAQTTAVLAARGIHVVGIGARLSLPYPEDEFIPIALGTNSISPTGVDGNGDGDFIDDGEIEPGGPLVFVTSRQGDPIGFGSNDLGDAIVRGVQNIVGASIVTVSVAGPDAELVTVTTDPPSFDEVYPADRVCFSLTAAGDVAAGEDAPTLTIDAYVVANAEETLSAERLTFTPSPP